MIAKQLFDEISQKVSSTIANSPAKDIEKNAKAMLGSAFNKMDLVTREEFEVQQRVLIKTRQKLGELETRLAILEAALASKDVHVEDDAQDVPKSTKKAKKAEDKA